MELLHQKQEELTILRRDEGRLVGELAPFKAEFFGGQASHSDIERKALLSKLSMDIRASYREKGEKVTEAQLDVEAHAHEVYHQWMHTSMARRLEMAGVEAELAQVRANIEAAEGELKVVERRVRLNEEMLRVLRAEMTSHGG